MATLSRQKIEALRGRFRGQVLLPEEPGYDAARRIWNGMIDRRPAVIARCRGCADVIEAIAFARGEGLPTAIRGGGHNIAGNAVCQDGLMLDLSLMRSVRIDPEARRGFVEPGATLGDFDHEAQAFALATPLGINSTTGVAGLTLGGGFGWLTRKYGMSVDNLLAADVVTAEGTFRRTSAEKDPDLFWALRGGGGNFGVVTLFEFQLHPVGPEVFCGLVVFPLEQAREVLGRYREFAETLPEELSVWAVLRKAPPLPFLPDSVHGKEVVIFALFGAGDPDAARRQLEPVRDFGRPVGEHLGVQPYTAWQQAFDPLLTPGARNYWKSHNFTELADGALEKISDYAGRLPSPQTEIFIGQLGGQANRPAPGATAYAHRNIRYVLNVHTRWQKNEDDERCIGWAREFFAAAAPFAAGGVYVNFLTEEETGRIAAAYGPNYERLAQIKGRYDPGNFFRLNQNIQPRRS